MQFATAGGAAPAEGAAPGEAGGESGDAVDPAAAEVAARGGRRTLAWFEQHCAANGLD
jgi:hypothetical protein